MRRHGLIEHDADIRACKRGKNYEGAIDSRFCVLVVAKRLNHYDIASRGLKHGTVAPFQCQRLRTDEVWISGTGGENTADENQCVYGCDKQYDEQPGAGAEHVGSGSLK